MATVPTKNAGNEEVATSSDSGHCPEHPAAKSPDQGDLVGLDSSRQGETPEAVLSTLAGTLDELTARLNGLRSSVNGTMEIRGEEAERLLSELVALRNGVSLASRAAGLLPPSERVQEEGGSSPPDARGGALGTGSAVEKRPRSDRDTSAVQEAVRDARAIGGNELRTPAVEVTLPPREEATASAREDVSSPASANSRPGEGTRSPASDAPRGDSSTAPSPSESEPPLPGPVPPSRDSDAPGSKVRGPAPRARPASDAPAASHARSSATGSPASDAQSATDSVSPPPPLPIAFPRPTTESAAVRRMVDDVVTTDPTGQYLLLTNAPFPEWRRPLLRVPALARPGAPDEGKAVAAAWQKTEEATVAELAAKFHEVETRNSSFEMVSHEWILAADFSQAHGAEEEPLPPAEAGRAPAPPPLDDGQSLPTAIFRGGSVLPASMTTSLIATEERFAHVATLLERKHFHDVAMPAGPYSALHRGAAGRAAAEARRPPTGGAGAEQTEPGAAASATAAPAEGAASGIFSQAGTDTSNRSLSRSRNSKSNNAHTDAARPGVLWVGDPPPDPEPDGPTAAKLDRCLYLLSTMKEAEAEGPVFFGPTAQSELDYRVAAALQPDFGVTGGFQERMAILRREREEEREDSPRFVLLSDLPAMTLGLPHDTWRPLRTRTAEQMCLALAVEATGRWIAAGDTWIKSLWDRPQSLALTGALVPRLRSVAGLIDADDERREAALRALRSPEAEPEAVAKRPERLPAVGEKGAPRAMAAAAAAAQELALRRGAEVSDRRPRVPAGLWRACIRQETMNFVVARLSPEHRPVFDLVQGVRAALFVPGDFLRAVKLSVRAMVSAMAQVAPPGARVPQMDTVVQAFQRFTALRLPGFVLAEWSTDSREAEVLLFELS